MTDLAAYMAGLFAMLLLVGLTAHWHAGQREPLVRTTLAILLCWAAGMVYVRNTGNLTPWHFSIFTDAAAAFAVMYRPAGRVQGFIGLFYFFQIAWHVAYGIRTVLEQPASPQYYYDAITWIAWAQLLAMGVWCGGVWIGDSVHRLRHRRDAPDRRSGAANPRKAP